jgi:hypothetical protein
MVSELLVRVNQGRGRLSASSRRNSAARIHYVATALCRWLKYNRLPPHLVAVSFAYSVADRLRTPIRDWYEGYRTSLERSVREARNVSRQQLNAPVPAPISIEGPAD